MTITTPGRADTGAADDDPALPTARPMIETFDPRTGVSLGHVPDMDGAEVAAVVARARIAFEAWGGLPYAERREHILSVRDLMLDRLEAIVEVITSETGKLDAEAVFTEVMTACETIQYYARNGEKALRAETVSAGLMSHKKAVRTYEPLGVVGVISPWNYPF
ncbi:MAG TPA: aldehyde dehydrogenase family protein, partial [Acidimicrobiales bacterium]